MKSSERRLQRIEKAWLPETEPISFTWEDITFYYRLADSFPDLTVLPEFLLAGYRRYLEACEIHRKHREERESMEAKSPKETAQ